MKRRLTLLVLLGSLLAGALAAVEVPFLSGPVVDLVGLVPDDVRNRLEARLLSFHREQGPQVVVLTLDLEDGDGRVGGEALGEAVGLAVEHEVAQDDALEGFPVGEGGQESVHGVMVRGVGWE